MLLISVKNYQLFRGKYLFKLSLLISICSMFSVGYLLYYTDSNLKHSHNSDWLEHTRSQKTNEHNQRVEHMRHMCHYLKHRVARAKYKDIQKMQDLYTVNWKTSFCVIPKSGCSFQKQLIMYLNEPSSFITEDFQGPNVQNVLNFVKQMQKDVFSISRATVHSLFFNPVALSMDQFVHGSFIKVMTTRNPYSRLYSAYIDKVYIPVFRTLLEDNIRAIRQNKYTFRTTHISPCDTKYTTFEEFLQAVLLESSNGQGDKHWLPVTSLCQPCRVHPDIIVKQENYHDDMQYVLSHMSLDQVQKDTIQSVFGKHGIHSDEILLGLIKTMLLRGFEYMGNCFTKIEMVKRVWEALQVQGQIYQYLQFPYANLQNVENLSVAEIAEVFMSQLHQYPITTQESQQQRNRALARAFRNIRKEVIIKIQAMYYYDFMLFDYDLNPQV